MDSEGLTVFVICDIGRIDAGGRRCTPAVRDQFGLIAAGQMCCR